jgi:hypothetical protein
MSILSAPSNAAPPFHAAWSSYGGFFCHSRRIEETKAQRAKRTYFFNEKTTKRTEYG